MTKPTQEILFGGDRGWNASDWTASDDRVRGGQSHSYLKIEDTSATFCGNLDIDTLGGAGFASQRTTGDDRHWDLSHSEAIVIVVDAAKSDDKRYTFILKDEILPPNLNNGREQSTTSWEYDFEVKGGCANLGHDQLTSIVIPWNQLKPTYRGKEADPGRPVRSGDIRRVSVMMRSFFGNQKGEFSLCIMRIAAVCVVSGRDQTTYETTARSSESSSTLTHKFAKPAPVQNETKSIWTRLFSVCNKL